MGFCHLTCTYLKLCKQTVPMETRKRKGAADCMNPLASSSVLTLHLCPDMYPAV